MLAYIDVMNMLQHIIRIPSLFTVCKDILEDSCFHIPLGQFENIDAVQELPLLYIWQALKAYYRDNPSEQNPPTFDLMVLYVREILREDVPKSDELIQRMTTPNPKLGFLSYMWSMKEVTVKTGLSLIKAFLKERLVNERTNSIMTFGQVRQDDWETRLAKAVKTLERVNTLGAVYAPTSIVPSQEYVDGITEDDIKKPVGIEYLDLGLGGGTLPKDVCAIVGGSGAGKTTFCSQIAVSSWQQSLLETKEGEPVPLTVYYTYEQSEDEIRKLFVSLAAQIPRQYVEFTAGSYRGVINPSTDPLHPKDYERRLWSDERYRESEKERLDRFAKLSTGSLIIRNFSGVADLNDPPEIMEIKRSLGSRGLDELAEDLAYLSNYYHAPIRTVIIDYVGQMFNRMPAVTNENRQDYMSRFGDDCRIKVAGRFGCVVWAAAQLNGVSNNQSPGAPLTLGSVAGCRMFAFNMPCAIMLGIPDKKDHSGETGGGPCLRMCMVKHRRSVNAPIHQGIIVQHDALFPRLNDVTSQYFWPPGGNADGFRYKRARC